MVYARSPLQGIEVIKNEGITGQIFEETPCHHLTN